jgi:hypothetical protein
MNIETILQIEKKTTGLYPPHDCGYHNPEHGFPVLC